MLPQTGSVNYILIIAIILIAIILLRLVTVVISKKRKEKKNLNSNIESPIIENTQETIDDSSE